MIKKIKILLIEENRILSEGISALLKKQTDMKIIANVVNAENIMEQIEALKPDIVLLDLGFRGQNSLQLVKQIMAQFKETKIIGMNLIEFQTDVLEFIQAGVSGFILKEADNIRFLKAIRKVDRGLKVLPPPLTGTLFSQIAESEKVEKKTSILNHLVRMTTREKQVIKLISDGLTNKEIAQELNVAVYTAKSHVHNILEKLSLTTRAQIAKYALLNESSKNPSDTISLLDD
jgi:DNA-binding NarL/FixJ family response regulator